MTCNLSDERFRLLDPLLGVENSNAQSQINEATEGSSSTSSHLREESIQMETVEAEMDELRRTTETNQNTSGMIGGISRIEERVGLGRSDSQVPEAARSSYHQGQLDVNRQISDSGEASPVIDLHIQQRGKEKGDRNSDSRHEGELVESRHEGDQGKSQMNSQKQGNFVVQKQGNHDGHHLDTSYLQLQHRITNLNKEIETNLQQQISLNINT